MLPSGLTAKRLRTFKFRKAIRVYAAAIPGPQTSGYRRAGGAFITTGSFFQSA